MATTALATPHIVADDQGRPWIAGTKTKVIEVVVDQIAYGWSPEEMHRQHPHLSLAQLHAALSYYYDHQAEIDAQIQKSLLDADKQRMDSIVLGKQLSRVELERRLRERGKSM